MNKLLMLLIILLPVQAQAEYVYFSPNGYCTLDGYDCLSSIQVWQVTIRTEGVSGVMGAHFRVDPAGFSDMSNDNILSISPHTDVTIVSGDLFSGMTLTWPTDLYSAGPLLTVTLNPDNMPTWVGTGIFTRDIYLIRESMPPVILDDFEVYCTQCNTVWGYINWLNPDTMTAVIGSETTIEFIAQVYGDGPGLMSIFFDVLNESGWHQECLDFCSVSHYCGICPWDLQTVQVLIDIPAGTEQGTVNKVSLFPTHPLFLDDSTTVYVIAEPDVSTETESWGKIKSMFKQ